MDGDRALQGDWGGWLTRAAMGVGVGCQAWHGMAWLVVLLKRRVHKKHILLVWRTGVGRGGGGGQRAGQGKEGQATDLPNMVTLTSPRADCYQSTCVAHTSPDQLGAKALRRTLEKNTKTVRKGNAFQFVVFLYYVFGT